MLSRRATGLQIVYAILALTALAVVGCNNASPSSTASPPPTPSSSITADASSTTTTGASPLVILLTEQESQTNYYNDAWQGTYDEPLFALWPDGRMMVRVDGGYGDEPPVYKQATLNAEELEQLQAWATSAEVTTLADNYSLQGGISDPLVWRLEVGDSEESKVVTFEKLPFLVDEPAYPARLDIFIGQLMNYRPAQLAPFIPDSIRVVVVERAALAGANDTLPSEFDLASMKEVIRTVEEVRYQAVLSGEEGAKARGLLDAGEFSYSTEHRTYYVYYRPVLEWPTLSTLLVNWLGTTSSSASTAPSVATSPVNWGPVKSFARGLCGDGYFTIRVDWLKESDKRARMVVVRVDRGGKHATYDDIFDHATALARHYGIADSAGGRLRVVLVEATSDHEVLETRDFNLTAGE